uniref:Coilin n=1 Tax=Nothoprocta perdicaria TaxID=30464 RepID=A0A8C6YYZ8_NOTPE
MAAGSGGALRLRLLFDYPPPGSPGCALCWLLLEPAQVRLVTDLLSLIRQRFGFSRRARLSLFLEGALLPPAESARLVRDNDSLRDEERGRRRRKRSEEREAAASDGETPRKRKRRKRKEESGAQEGPAAGEEGSGAGRIRRAKRAASKRTEGTRAPAKAASAREQDGKSGAKGSARSGAPGAAPSEPSSTSSSSDSSEGNARQNKSSHKPAAATTLPKNASPAAANSSVKTGVSSKVTVKSKAAQSKTAVSKKTNQAQSSSSDSDSSAEEGKAATAQNSATQKKLLPNNTAPVKTRALPSPVLGRGRGTGDGNFWKGSRGRGFQGAARGRQKQRQINEPVTNTSIVVQNPVEVPKRNYSVLPLLAAPPQVGERIAFKVKYFWNLECWDVIFSCCFMKEGKIISWNADKKQIELEILSSPAVAKEPGKFDLVYQSADGAELIEYAVPQDTKVLIVEPSVNGSNLENGRI